MSAVRALRRWELDDGVCEALKWVAFAAMVVDHANTVLWGQSPLGFAIGRLAMPIFCLVFGYNLARPGVEPGRAVCRLLWVGIPTHILAVTTINQGELLPLNILLTFAAALLLLKLGRGWLWTTVLLLLVAVTVDYSLVGVGLLLASLWFWRSRTTVSLAGLGFALACLCVWNGNLWALAGVAAVWAGTRLVLDVPRWPRMFLVAYPAHLFLLAILANW